jgi:hypothetical protein
VSSGTRVSIEVNSGYDARKMLVDIKSRVDAINTFHGEAENPVVSLAQSKLEVIAVTIAGIYG